MNVLVKERAEEDSLQVVFNYEVWALKPHFLLFSYVAFS
jgi:hypothetical protein